MVKGRDARLGACADTGHWLRSNITPVNALKILEGRIISSHLKDLNEVGDRAHDVPFGAGAANIPAILNELRRQGFNGNISIEYEYNWENSVPEVAQCIGFVRGYAAGLGQRRGLAPGRGRATLQLVPTAPAPKPANP
jgi:sugar phosphate isomerase/epimerase